MSEKTENYQIDKKMIKIFAASARIKLIAGVTQKAYEFGITDQKIQDADSLKINDLPMDEAQQKQREHLVERIKDSSLNEVIEEIAYTWFNRFIALRFMEVNDYLPTGIRILSSIDGKGEPDAMRSAIIELIADELELNKNQIYQMQDDHDEDHMFKYILVKQCNQLGKIMKSVFEPISDETELLLPDRLLATTGVITELVDVTKIPESNWKHVEIMGWCYQFYNAEIKEQVGGLKNHSVSKEELPIVTQLYTPKWIVKYMVQNSLGRMYDQGNPDNHLSLNWAYYLKDDHEKLTPNPKFNGIEDIKIFDPACGSGHILVYAFDMLFGMYEEAGFSTREIPELILKNNLFGLDIDQRAVQITHISLWMKALENTPRILNRPKDLEVHVYSVPDCDPPVSEEALNFFAENDQEKSMLKELEHTYQDGKQFGSLLTTKDYPFDEWLARFNNKKNRPLDLFESEYLIEIKKNLIPVIKAASLLHQKYQVVVTNPPYHNKYNPILKKFMQDYYKDTKSDLYSTFIYRTLNMTQKNGYAALMSPFTWMFISTHEKLRQYLLSHATISSLVQLEYSAFEEATVPVCTFVLQNQHEQTKGQYIRLADFKGASLQPIKVREAIENSSASYRYTADSTSFSDIPGSPIAYWASDQVRKIFRENPSLGDTAEPRVGLQTGDNDQFLRIWYEVEFNRIGFNYKSREDALQSKYKWFPYNKGGAFRKWYGNMEYVVNWEKDGNSIRNLIDDNEKMRSRPQNTSCYFHESTTWSKITSSSFSVRYNQAGSIFDVAGTSIFGDHYILLILLGFLNSRVANHLLTNLSETLNFEVGNIKKLPIINEKNDISKFISENIFLSKSDWDSFETSWDFKQHPFQQFRNGASTISEAFNNWSQEADRRFTSLKANEEELNRIFINLYGLQDELTPEESDDEVTVRRVDRERDVKSFLSYCVGIMFGRYSLDEDRLVFAGGIFERNRYQAYKPDKDNVIPITDETYFEDDIVGRLIDIVKQIFGERTLEQNLDFIAESLKKKSGETARQRIRRYFLKEYYKDHVQIYKKRPIYWLFDSGKENGFKALIYLHRYEPGLVARVRIDYLHAMERKYEEEMRRLDLQMEAELPERDKVRARKQKENLEKQLEECRQYDQVVAHVASLQIALDLDNGVKENYIKFQNIDVPGKKVRVNLLAKI
ncbi:BREX-1 system adenine-specific DNA-methyltransferase PglX [Sporolactobacillus spathodeae]|uniref:site-specific DNA-methyltransferase (adenine-specific) n=1 Tax=Sporolactobacillus spathodeae TaxID=1465502 RepID=A0ABS2Q9Z7_9BACL|nr:BREX-1 system adenine-specific DNA-methyltransferase PglX [Sporolactobacillus spathodeae]MBM7658628.1 hypothetical protein [Sporolactobacillus spathodeae]